MKKTIDCIESIRQYVNMDYKIYLLDNASPNKSGSILAQKYSGDEDIDLILSKENLGYAKGNNVCINKMIEDQCKYGIVSNNDIVFGPNIDKLIGDLMQKIGLFDPNTFLFYEEDILAAKAKKANMLLGYDPNVSVMHYHGASTGGVLNVNTVIASTISEQYYFNTYTDFGSSYSRLIRWIHFLEEALLSAKKNKWGNISIYVKGVRKGLEK